MKFSSIMRAGNLIVNFYCNQMSTKNVIVCYVATVRTLLFFKSLIS